VVKEKEIPDARLWLVMTRAHAAIVPYLERSITEYGLCFSKFMILEVLLHKGPLPISAIGEKVSLASASMTSAIDGLEKLGFVVRKDSKEDRRARLVSLTPQGRKLITKLFARHEKDLEVLMKGLSEEQRTMMYEGLKIMGHLAKDAGMPPEKHQVA
jgi:MarR family transcriptional regulator, 2-MHQ and catechol-resistance regulon repressor